MTKEETIKVMALLNGFYPTGKVDAKQQAFAWHLVLGKFDFNDAMAAVMHFAEHDTREYASFPSVGCIVNEISNMRIARKYAIKDVIKSISYGKDYEHLTNGGKTLISKEMYDEWSKVDAMEFAQNSDKYAEILKDTQMKLLLNEGAANEN